MNLTAVTEARGVAGCNGIRPTATPTRYSNGTTFVNEKKWKAAVRYFTDSRGAFYENDWLFVEGVCQDELD